MFLNCHTHFSFKYGTLSPKALLQEVRRNGVKQLALTDINATAGHVELLRLLRDEFTDLDLQLAFGIEFRYQGQLRYIGIAKSLEGFRELNAFLSFQNTQPKPMPSRAPLFQEAFIIYPMAKAPEHLLPHEYVGVRLQDLRKWRGTVQVPPDKGVIWHPVTFAPGKDEFYIHRILRAIDQNTLFSKLTLEQQATADEYFIPPQQLKKAFADHPQWIRNTEEMLDSCHIDFELGKPKNKRFVSTSVHHDEQQLFQAAEEGLRLRYPHISPVLQERFDRELNIIRQKDFTAYYLLAYDIIRFAEAKGFAHVGRGSGANSLVSYCLGITDVDPMELDLYFERFLNPSRSSPPDFDIDFSWKDRDEVIRYIFEKHGTRHTALLGTHVTMKDRALLRELGKVFGLPKEEIDRLAEEGDRAAKSDAVVQHILRCGKKMIGREIPNHLSIHAGGILISHEPIHCYTATDMPPKGFPVAHLEMHNAEDLGLYKLDILSQRGLGHIKDTLQLIQDNGKEVPALASMKTKTLEQDPKIKELLSTGNTMGCFYVESPAMRMLLGKLRCQDYLTLVAASSIIRPGVARSGMMRAYIERHLSGGQYTPIHPLMDKLMAETYGVMVYQEDVIKVAHHFAGLTLSEADILRRGMSGKYRSRSEFQRVKEQFFHNCREKGYAEAVTQRVWFEIESFSGYSFAKGHSASYAVESYESLYLKAHYPLEFMVGVINNFGGFYKTEFYFHEARMAGAEILPPCINKSRYYTHIEDKTIYIGLVHLNELGPKIAETLLQQREKRGAFASFEDFLDRVPIRLEHLLILIRINAFRFTGRYRKELMWEAHAFFNQHQKKSYSLSLFPAAHKQFHYPQLETPPLEEAYEQMAILGFPLCSPFLLADTTDLGQHLADDLRSLSGKWVHILGYMVTTKNTQTKQGDLMHFGTFYDREGNVFDTTHFPNIAKRFAFRGRGFYRIKGKVVEDFGYPMVEVSYMEKIPWKKLGTHEKLLEELYRGKSRSGSWPHQKPAAFSSL